MSDASSIQFRGSPYSGLVGATLGFFAGFAAVALFGPMADRFQDAMGLDPTLVGLLIAMPSLSGSLLRIPFAAWVDTDGGRTPFLVLFALSLTGMAGLCAVIYLWYPDDLTFGFYPLVLVLGLLSGSGIALFTVGVGQVSYWFPKDEQGWALGTYAGVGNLAPGLFTFVIPIALDSVGLAHSYLVWFLFLAAGALVYYFTGRNAWYFQAKDAGLTDDRARELAERQGQELFPADSPLESIKSAARTWHTWPLVLLYFTTFGGFLALTSWLPTYCKSYLSSGGMLAGSVTGAFSILSSAIRVPGGSLADRFGGEKTALASLACLLAGSVVASLATGVIVAVVGLLIMAVSMGVNNAAVFKLVPEYCPEAVGGASGWVGGLGAFGGFALPPVMGLFVTLQGDAGYANGFLTFAALALVGIGLVLVLSSRSKGSDRP
ncbi:MAG: nitrate/nitrite transporter [Bradymonadaceae bacterium]